MTPRQTIRIVRIALALAAISLAVVLLTVRSPWETGLSRLISEGAKIPLDAFIAEGTWLAAAANLAIVLVLLASVRWWLVPCEEETAAAGRLSLPGGGIFLLALGGVVAFAAVDRVPRLSQSLWNDEEYTLRRYVFGETRETSDGSLEFRPVKWEQTLFYNRGANNHIPFSITARISLAIWKAFAPPGPMPFSEAALRFPAFLAGLASIALLGIVVALLSHNALAGTSAALILALHPWHLRYSVEARGYAFLLCFALAAVWFLIRALDSGRWRHWLGFGVCQFVYLASFPGAVYLAATLNAGAILLILAANPPRRHPLAARWAVANVFSAAAFLQLMGPSIRQIKLYLERDIAQGTMDAGWFRDIWSHVAAGIRWVCDDPANPLYLSMDRMTSVSPVARLAFFLVIPVLLVLGGVRLIALGRKPAILLLAPVAAAVLAFVHTRLSGNFLFGWYLLYLLVPFCGLLALGCQFLAGGVSAAGSSRQWLQLPVSIAVIALFALVTAFPRTAIRTWPRQPLREAVAIARGPDGGAYSPGGPDVLTAAFGTSCRQFQSYDPLIHPLDGTDGENARELQLLLADTRASGRRLAVLVAGAGTQLRGNPELSAILLDPAAFESNAVAPGLESMFSYRVYEFSPSHGDR